MAKRGRPAQGNNTKKKLVKLPAGGDNVNARGAKRPARVNNSKPRRTNAF